MNIRRVAVWIDRQEAKLFELGAEPSLVNIEAPHHHLTHKHTEQGAHVGNKAFFDEVAAAIRVAQEILIVGPSSAKLDFIRHLHQHDAELEKRVVGVETVDHPTNGQLIAYVRHYFHDNARMDAVAP